MSPATLRYRSVGHQQNPNIVDDVESKDVGRYRGRQTSFAYPRHIPVPQTTADLQYHGIQYCVNTDGEVEAIAPDAVNTVSTIVTPKVMTMRPMINARKALMREVSNVHRQNIQRSLQHRINVAKEHGNDQLVRQLEQEMQQFA